MVVVDVIAFWGGAASIPQARADMLRCPSLVWTLRLPARWVVSHRTCMASETRLLLQAVVVHTLFSCFLGTAFWVLNLQITCFLSLYC
jgi:hypothetical protein